MSRIIGITGHRPETLSQAARWRVFELIEDIKQFVLAQPADTEWISGGARGVDTWAGTAAMEFAFRLRLYLPFPVAIQSLGWTEGDRFALESMNAWAHDVWIARPDFHPSAYFIRDRKIVEDSDELFAVWDGRDKGGTAATVKYARKVGKKISVLDPETGVVRVEEGRGSPESRPMTPLDQADKSEAKIVEEFEAELDAHRRGRRFVRE